VGALVGHQSSPTFLQGFGKIVLNLEYTAGLSRLNWLRPWTVVAAVTVAHIAIILVLHQGDPMALVNIGTRFDPGLPGGSMGYDGQYSYQIARDPFEGWIHIDDPAYRYQRVLYPLFAKILAAGKVDWIPWSLLTVNIFSIVLGVLVTEEIMVHYGANRWYALVYGLNIGMLSAVRLDLNEPLAFLLFMFGVLCFIRERMMLSALLFGMASLTKEVTLVLSLGFVVNWLISRKWAKGYIGAALVLAPFFIWQGVLKNWLGGWGVSPGWAQETPFEILPLKGWWGIALYDFNIFLLMSLVLLPLAIFPAVLALGMSLRELLKRSFDPFLLALLFQSAVFLFLPAAVILDPLGLSRFTIGLIAALLIFGAQRGSRRVLLYTQLWMITLVFIINESFLPMK
jgi:hypothetical protein